jgi:hypothetical protein
MVSSLIIPTHRLGAQNMMEGLRIARDAGRIALHRILVNHSIGPGACQARNLGCAAHVIGSKILLLSTPSQQPIQKTNAKPAKILVLT